MRIIIERDALTEAVAWVARSLPSRPVLPILSGMLLEASAGSLTLSCFDYEVSARIQVDAEVTEDGIALVPGRLLAEITRSLPSLPVELDHEKDDVIVTCGPASFTLVTLPVKEYPRLPELPLLAGTVDGGVLTARSRSDWNMPASSIAQRRGALGSLGSIRRGSISGEPSRIQLPTRTSFNTCSSHSISAAVIVTVVDSFVTWKRCASVRNDSTSFLLAPRCSASASSRRR